LWKVLLSPVPKSDEMKNGKAYFFHHPDLSAR